MQPDIAVPCEWYRNFFTAPVNLFWEKMVPEEATEADLAFVRRHLGVEPPAHVLDVPCGAGRHALGLARAGYRVTGVDISEDAIARASTAAHAQGLAARFEQGDMRFLDLGERFDALLCLGNSIGYFEPEETAAFLGRLAASLRPGGRLILDSYCCAESIFPLQEEREITFEGGSYVSEYSYDPMRSVLSTSAKLRLGDEEHALLYAHQVVTSGELVRLLATAGLRTVALHGDTDDQPYAPGMPRLLLVATRE
jgi:cyclopropane fatty-acyl-phospholipid synthase-like methyltransferase